MSGEPERPTPTWILMGILILMFVFALFGAYKAVSAAGLDVWTIRLISVDYDKGEVTLRLIDLNALIRSHNMKIDRLNALKKVTGCT